MFELHSRLSRVRDGSFGFCSALRSVCLPDSLAQTDLQAFEWSTLQYVGIGEGNRHFSISGSLLLNFEGTIIVGHVGPVAELLIENSIEELGDGCFLAQFHLSSVTFAAHSRVRRIGIEAFFDCFGLTSIVIPASVELIGAACFGNCFKLSTVRFEPNSRLSVIEADAFENNYADSKTVCIPFAIEGVVRAAFGHYWQIATITES
jgi:hypothetical protein